MSVFPFMVFLFFYELVLVSSELVYSELPSSITALSGSCVQIPCKFNGSEISLKNTETVFGFWIMKDHAFARPPSLVVFNGRANIITGFSHIEILGNLSQRECTTVFYDVMKNHSDKYYFRVETSTAQKYTYQNPIYISVSDSPQPLVLKPTDLKEVMEETTVHLNCSAEAPCPKQPPTISWSNIPESAHITTQLQEKHDKTQSVFSHMTFKASYMDHRRNISCTATYPRNTLEDSTVETSVMLRVLFPPKETHIIITPSASVSVGTNVTLTCKSKASPSNDMTYTWYKHGQEMPIAQGKKISFIVTHNNTGSYFCIAQNKHGKQSSAEIQLTVEGERGFFYRVIFGCTGALLAFVLLSAIFFYCMRTNKSSQDHVIERDQATDKNSDMAIYANSSSVSNKKSEKKENDGLHYGEIDFSRLQMGNMTREDSNNGPQTVYAEIQMTGRNNKKTVEQMD